MRKLIISFVFSLLYQYIFSQSANTNIQINSINQSIDNYKNATKNSTPIYNGIEHIGYPNFYEGFAYFGSNDWQNGTIIYEGIEYPDVFLKYDMVTDRIIIRNPAGFAIMLFSPRTSSFSISNKKFIYLQSDKAVISSGFYQQLVTGKMTLLAKKTKVINEDISTGKLIKRFAEKDGYYVLIDGKYHSIKNQPSILNLMGEKKKGIKNYLKGKKLKYKNDPETVLISIAEFFNGSTK